MFLLLKVIKNNFQYNSLPYDFTALTSNSSLIKVEDNLKLNIVSIIIIFYLFIILFVYIYIIFFLLLLFLFWPLHALKPYLSVLRFGTISETTCPQLKTQLSISIHNFSKNLSFVSV